MKSLLVDEMAIAAGQMVVEKKYWLNKLSGDLDKSHFPYAYNKRDAEGFKMESFKCKWDDEIFSGLMKLSKGSDPRVFMILLAVLIGILHKYTGNRDIIVGAPISTQAVEGDFINTVLALRNNLNGGTTFKKLLLQVRETLIEAAKHQNYPFETLLTELNLSSYGEKCPLFDIGVLLENIHKTEYIQGVGINMLFAFLRSDDFVELEVEYNALVYDGAMVEQMIAHFRDLAAVVLNDVDIPIEAIDILSGNEKKQLLIDFNDTVADYPGNITIHRLFEEFAAGNPHGIAVTLADKKITYRALNQKANKLARFLKKRGFHGQSIAGIKMEKSIEMIVGILGILKAGGIFLPLDVTLPEKRLDFIVKDSRISMLLYKKDRMEKPLAGDFSTVDIDTEWDGIEAMPPGNPGDSVNPESLAYVIYTSGSTGTPKGVLLEHRGVINLANWQARYFRLKPRSRVAQFFSFSFDGAVGETFMGLLNGATLVMLDTSFPDPRDILQTILLEEVSVIVTVPSLIRQIDIDLIKNPGEFTVVSVGEVCPVDLAEKWSGKCNFVNGYGPTEYTVYSHTWKVTPDAVKTLQYIPIGTPIDNSKSYILDGALHPVPIGVPGEIYISGVGIARGYMNRRETSDERFIPNPFFLKDEYSEEGEIVLNSAVREIEMFKKKDSTPDYEKNFRKAMQPPLLSHNEVLNLVDVLDPDLVASTRAFLDKYRGNPFAYDGFCRYLLEGVHHTYYSCGINKEMLSYLLACEDFQGVNGVDFGLGNAEIQQILSDAGSCIRGLDIDPFFVRQARDKGLDAHMARVDIDPGIFLTETGLREGTVDFVVSTLVLDRVENPGNLVKNMLAILKQEGRIAIQTLLPIVPFDDEDVENPIVYTPVQNRITPGTDAEEDKLYLVELLYELGVRDIKIHRLPFGVHTNSGFQDYTVWSFCGIKQSSRCPDPGFKYYKRMYKTGDLGCYLPDGNIYFLGRVDNQVKIRGFRIELEEIEKHLHTHEDVKEAAVIIKKDNAGNDYLYAYLVSTGDPEVTTIQDFLAVNLPGYMVPAHYVKLERMPLNAAGKIDRKQLEKIDAAETAAAAFLAPRTELEETLAEIWQNELNVEKVGVKDNYFNIGGDSIKSIALLNSVNEELGLDLKVADLYLNNTIEKLAVKITEVQRDGESIDDDEYNEAVKELEYLQKSILEGGQ